MKAENKQIILSIDAATKTGWAIYKNNQIIVHGTERFRISERVSQYFVFLTTMIEKHKITHVVAEDIYREHSRTKDQAFYVLAKMQGALECAVSMSTTELTLLNPLQVKSFMIPSFRKRNRAEDKQRMINRIKSLGYQLKNDKADDEADAIGILITYLNNHDLPVIHPKAIKK